MKYNFPEINVVAQTEEITPSDEHILLVSLARLFKTDVDTVPLSHGYLKAEPDYIKKWEKIRGLSGVLRVGICWAGRSVAEQDLQVAEWNSRRSIALRELGDVLKLPNISWVSLQKGIDEVQLNDYKFIHDYGSQIENWSDTAGIMHHLDLIISIDSGPVHLAGAMNCPTWLLNHASTCWRWALEGSKSPWYDSVSILRQEKDFDWSGTVEELKKRLIIRKAA